MGGTHSTYMSETLIDMKYLALTIDAVGQWNREYEWVKLFIRISFGEKTFL